MKKLPYTFIFILSGFYLQAQVPANNAAKAQYKTFNTCIEKLKTMDPVAKSAAYKNQLSQAENALNNIKKYEPGYNAQALEAEISKHKTLVGDVKRDEAAEDMEKLRAEIAKMKESELKSVADGGSGNWGQVQYYLDMYKNKFSEQELAPFKKELEEYKAGYKAKVGVKNEEKSNLSAFEKEFKKVFIQDRYDLDTDVEKDLPVIEENLKTYQKNLEAFVTPDHIAKALKTDEPPAKNIYKDIISAGAGVKGSIAEIKKNIGTKYFTRKVRAVSAYCKLQSYQIKYACYKKLFGDKPELVALSDEINKEVKSAGTKEELIALAAKNYIEEVKNRRMRPSVRNDASLETDIKNGLKKLEGSIVKISLLDPDWKIERNPITGIAVKRYQNFEVVMKKNNGTCRLYYLFVSADFDGAKYLTNLVTGYGDDGEEILCENVK